MKAKRIIYIVVFVILLAIFAVSAVYVADYFIDSHNHQSQYEDLASIVESVQKETEGSDPSDGPAPTDPSSEKPILPEYQELYELNNDLVGWLKIDGTRVNYPVLQSPDSPDFYLYRDFYKERNIRGNLYARETCDINKPSDNITIYGHYMADGTMFHDLHNYMDEKFYKEHDIIIFDTLTEHHKYRIFAVFKTTASIGQGFPYHRFEDAATEQEFNEFIRSCITLSLYDTGIVPVYGDKIICLSTCEYSRENGRLVVAAYRIE